MRPIVMKSLAAGPDGAMLPGRTYSVDDLTAAELVEGGYAVYADSAPLERAIAPKAPEEAVRPEARHVGGGWYEYQGRKMRKADLPEGVL